MHFQISFLQDNATKQEKNEENITKITYIVTAPYIRNKITCKKGNFHSGVTIPHHLTIWLGN